MWTIELAVMIVMIALNSVFEAYEIALASVSVARLNSLAREHIRGAAAALRMKQEMEASLAVIQLGITLVGAVAAATGGAGAEEMIEPTLRGLGLSPGIAQFGAIALVVLPLTVISIIFGELVPKVFALRNTEWVCLQMSRPMEWFSKSVWPVVRALEFTVRLIVHWGERRWKPSDAAKALPEEAALQELRAVAALARTSRLIGKREEGIIVSASRLSTTPLRAIMLPAQYMSLLPADATLEDALIAAHRDMHTRFPVTEQPRDPQRTIGYVNFKDIVSRLRGIVRSLPSFDEETSVATCLENLIRNHNHIALVRNRDLRVVGMVTMEDLLEELVGEIHDEYDRLPSHITPAGRGWVIGGNATLAEVHDATGVQLPSLGDKPLHTFSDWVITKLGRPPQGGLEVRTESLRIVIRKIRRQLVQEAQLIPLEPGEDAEESVSPSHANDKTA